MADAEQQAAPDEPEEGDGDAGAEAAPRSLLDRFPALERLRGVGRRRIPYVQQMELTDCGAASLAMALGYHGKRVRLEEVREVCAANRDGINALALLRAARYYGLRGRGVKLEMDELEHLEPASILHWEFNHFLVFERLRADAVDVVDPAMGRRRIPLEQFNQSFTGVALLLEPTEAFERKDGGARGVWRYLRQLLRHSGVMWRVLMVSLVLQIFALAVPLLTGLLVDRVIPRQDYHLMTVLAVGLLSIVVFNFLGFLERAHLLLNLRTYLDSHMTLGFIEHLVDLPYFFFQQRSSGDLMMRLNSNATIREILTSNALSGILDGVLVLLQLGLLLAVSAKAGLLVLALGLIEVGIFLLSRRRYQDLMSQNLQTQAKSQSYLVQLLSGIETLKVSGAEHRAVEHWSNLFVDELNVSLDRGRLSATVDSVMGALRIGAPLLVLGLGGFQVLHAEVSLGTMLALNALAIGFLAPLSGLVGTAFQLQLLGSYLERIDDVLQTEPEQDQEKVTPSGKLRGAITLEKVSFRYGPLSPMVVRDVSVEIRPGQYVAIVGRSGSGKSSLAGMLVGLYRPTVGRILFDNNDLADLDVRSVRGKIGIVMQHPYFFNSSVRSNIALSEPALPLDRVVQAAKTAQIHDDVVAMPMGYETILAGAGASMSGGQRQRIALARALVHKPAILLLDEATSALDTVTERAVQQNLEALRCTRIVIAHRLSTVVGADVILVMEEGRIVEQGRHEELLVQGGVYTELVAAQLEGRESAAPRAVVEAERTAPTGPPPTAPPPRRGAARP